jgi:hypothetical protein
MGQHTWFIKDQTKYKQLQAIYERIEAQENGAAYYDDFEILEMKADALYDEIDCDDFHDVFRTNKRNILGQYTDDIITSREECFKWLEDNKDTVYGQVPNAHEILNKFWDKYPNGLIRFG